MVADVVPDDSVRVSALFGVLYGVAGVGTSAVAVALPQMGDEFGVSAADTAWAMSLYILMLAVMTAVYGRVADVIGVRTPLAVGLALTAGGAATAALAPSLPVLLAARVFQGAGAAALPILGVAALSARYDGVVRGRALGRLAGVATAIVLLAPLAGGIVEHWLGWRAVVALPVLGLLVMPFLWTSISGSGTGARLDVAGALLVGLTAAGLVLLVQSPSAGGVVAMIGCGLLVVGVPSTVLRVRRLPHGFLPRAVITNGTVVRSALAAAVLPSAWFGMIVAVPAILDSQGWQAWQIGLLLVPSAVIGALVPGLVAPLIRSRGPTVAICAGIVIAAAALTVGSFGAYLGSAAVLAGGMVLVTIAFGTAQPALGAAVGEAVAEDVRGVALGIATFFFLTGGSVGAALIGVLSESVGESRALALMCLLPVLGSLALLPLLRRTSPRE